LKWSDSVKSAEIDRLRKLLRLAGIRVRGLDSDADKTISNLKQLFAANDLQANVSEAKAKEFKQKKDWQKDVEALDPKHIIGDVGLRTTRQRRTVSYTAPKLSGDEFEDDAPEDGAKESNGDDERKKSKDEHDSAVEGGGDGAEDEGEYKAPSEGSE